MTPTLPAPLAPVSWGELLDKITILEIKAARIPAPAARANVAQELALLNEIAAPVMPQPGLAPLIEDLRRVNQALWTIEDDIRACEAAGDFGAGFVALARAVYRTNDQRAAIKRQVNALLGSALVEEKFHAPSAPGKGAAGGR
ncbi:DUF6165 family protein [Paracoccus contaminans]|uniref:Uncharacterized protein n=1 Tax=Paracoccus contaminans TaxID=1945662 RepID=A0A1W6D041_9RHOB|nr:DUF6165 family protein [Paracoccus contaminans]ARJ70504.1 hypothetical protein B0A89_13560 [Paracoccus contaminans]